MKKKTFPHGTHPPEHKDLTADKPLEAMPAPGKVFIPLHQHFGAPANRVLEGPQSRPLAGVQHRRQGDWPYLSSELLPAG